MQFPHDPNNPQPQFLQSHMLSPGMIPPMSQPGNMWKRAKNRIGRMQNIFPLWVSQYAVVIYFLILIIVSFIYSSNSLPWYYMLSGTVAIVVFFFYGRNVMSQTSIIRMRRERTFEKRILGIAFIPRIIWMFFIYFIFIENYGDAFGFDAADTIFYDELGKDLAISLRENYFIAQWRLLRTMIDLSDMGYGTYLAFIYWLTDDSIIVVRLLKCLWSSLTVLLIYRLTKRNFDPQIARTTAIFCALWPNFWYYCGSHVKEVEMVFLCVLFVEQADQMLRSKQFTAWMVIPILLIGTALFGFRTPLALVAFLSLIFSVVMSSSRVVNWGKRVIIGGLAILLIGVTMGNQISEETKGLMNTVQSGEQQKNMEWRSTRKDGANAYAKYAGKSVFAPLIFTIPFPTLVRNEGSPEMPQLLNGGNFVKNIISFFTIFSMVILLISGKWRDHLLPLSFLLGYLIVLTMSTFAQSERFHQPAMPFEFMFAAYGLSVAVTNPKYKRWFTYWCILMFVACVMWSWFRMAGRGLA